MDITKTTTKKPPVSFMGLPPEIRCDVYRYLLTWSDGIKVYQGLEERNALAILAVSRTINKEAVFIFYSENEFAWNVIDQEEGNLRIHSRFVPLLRSIKIIYDEVCPHPTANAMEALLLEFSGDDVKIDSFTFWWGLIGQVIKRDNLLAKALQRLKGTKHFILELSEGILEIGLEDGLEEDLRSSLETDGVVHGRTFTVVDVPEDSDVDVPEEGDLSDFSDYLDYPSHEEYYDSDIDGYPF